MSNKLSKLNSGHFTEIEKRKWLPIGHPLSTVEGQPDTETASAAETMLTAEDDPVDETEQEEYFFL